jgi:hypothetical protein
MPNGENATLTTGSVDTRTLSGTVWVVTARKDGAPASFVEAVYATEGAARQHKQALADPVRPPYAILWGVHEREIQNSFDREEVPDDA